MSTSPAAVPTTPSLHTGESYQEKAWRKFREQPLVPIGTLVTCGALIMATVKMRRGDSQSLNNWLRVRVIAQGATIAAVCAGTYVMGSTPGENRQLDEIQTHREARAGRDRKEFEDRLKAAERQWKETEGVVSGRDLNTNIAKGDSSSKALPSVQDQIPQSAPSRSGASWWWFKWPWGGSSAS
ncbi:hypoxia induced protein conserved region-domain-containing protein [Suillus bovinus]|uniref:hypoxia induced protein conserved region-domain-containing protein n=1 Tax=Suillus bovinus TaxID=48563 RepID=UPI001B885458|nr:hypoxia induced protein conserved region-domain-containing protein [Suillus bovinus]KAG2132509.1 hypoxia induced protein conserved region-domain-containing protein [Suillus bovinus]